MKYQCKNLNDAYECLADIATSHDIQSLNYHSAFWTFTHLKQSVDYSIDGYPSSSSFLYQLFIGKPVFGLFLLLGRMSHDLLKPIPGAPDIAESGNWQTALEAYRESLKRFEEYNGPLAPHFAYGTLSKKQFTNAHLMHLDHHLKTMIPIS